MLNSGVFLGIMGITRILYLAEIDDEYLQRCILNKTALMEKSDFKERMNFEVDP